ncbi:MAG: hypothetical protein U0790_07440 [Isosphaeraceae bacterium]
MIRFGLVLAASLLGPFALAQDEPPKAAALAPAADTEKLNKALAEYNAQREKVGNSPAAHWRLALWCEKNGLRAEALTHFGEVARLDPRRDAVWRKLGFKKFNGRWTTDEMVAEEKEQKAADRIWGPKLKKLHKDLHGANGPDRQASAQAELDAIKDFRAVPPLYREFGRGKLDQAILIQVLDQIEKPQATKLLAFLAVYGASPEVRKQATLSLRTRPSDDYLDLLVGLMADPINYEVRHVGGPGSPGVLFVEGERFNSARFYAPPAAPDVAPMPGDIVTLDQHGAPLILRPNGVMLTGGEITDTAGSKASAGLKGMTPSLLQFSAISPGRLQQEAQRGAVSAEAQLRADEQAIRDVNAARRRFNDLVMAVARDASGSNHGDTPRDWRDGLARANKQSPRTQPSRKATVAEVVPLAYSPWFGPSAYFFRQVFVDT